MFGSTAIHIRTLDEIEQLRKSSLLVGETLSEVAKNIKPGVTTKYLDTIAEEFIKDNNAEPVFKGYNGYPASLCISINEVVVHGIPGNREIKEGDIISIDCGTFLNGWVGDSAYTFAVVGVSEEAKKLMKVTKESLYLGIEKCVIGNRIGDLSHKIQSYCEDYGYGVVRELCGHGVGRKMHEEPEVPNFGKAGTGIKFKEGMVIAIEPMITMHKKEVVFERDGWTCRTKDMSWAAHYEHDVAITKNDPYILSSFEKIEETIKQNNNLVIV
ncbi:MAG: type I methionyl aminopeptidase [Bacteroidales bacterium]|jgi:methionyl aminopeptidase|nr:type I methionyl aminopeptidase [Bacteroidales bacterium]